jgi:hypothetical protein
VCRSITRLLVIGLIAIVLPTAAASRTERRTGVHHYLPFRGGKLAPGLKVGARARGRCWTGSANAYPRRSAWRCFRGRNIVDPCFAAPGATRFVACPDDAWNGRVLILRLTEALPLSAADPGGRRGRPRVWAIVTTTGLRCNRIEGALPQIDGKALRFWCGRDRWLGQEPNATKPLWTIHFAASQKSTRLRQVSIAEAWW